MTFFEKLKTLLSALFFQAEQDESDAQSISPDARSAQNRQIIFVKFEPDTPEATRVAAITDQLDGTIIRWLPQINTCIATISINDTAPDEIRRTMPSVTAPILHVEPDGVAQGCQTTAFPPFNDPNLPEAYGLRIIEAQDAWQFTTGDGVLVAVLDTGIDAEHPEFAGRLLPGQNLVDNGNSTADDDHGHGTHVCGIIGAALNNNQGAAGAAPNCTILPIKVLDSTNTGAWSDVITGILIALEQNAQVINLSLGSELLPPRALQETIQVASQNAVIVAAAGNANSQAEFYPAAYAEVIGVSATTEREDLWPFSNTGAWVTIAAPGEQIFSTAINQAYELRSGTSMAAGFVSGLAALLLAQNDQLTPAEVTEQITSTATPVADLSIPTGQIGSGRINAFDAVGGRRVFIPIVQT